MRVLLVLLLLAAAPAHATDYAREQRWADEVVPGLVVGDAVWLDAAGRRFLGIETPVRESRLAVLLLHGAGVHPDWGLIGTLRSRLADRGFTTLSIQLPVLGAEAGPDQYGPTYPEAVERIDAALRHLRGKGQQRVAVVAHSLGARMMNEYLRRRPSDAPHGWVAIGLTGAFDPPPALPVLDLYGSGDFARVLSAATERRKQLQAQGRSRQQMIEGADHFFEGKEDALAAAVERFLVELADRR